MVDLSLAEFKEKVLSLGFCIEQLKGLSSVRITPPSPCLLLSIPFNEANPLSLSPIGGDVVFYCIGREFVFMLPQKTNSSFLSNTAYRRVRHPVSMSCEELLKYVSVSQHNRSSTLDDFYAVPNTGTFMMYISHHDEILVYFGWRTIGGDIKTS